VAIDYAKRVTDWPTLEIAVGARSSLVHGRPLRKGDFRLALFSLLQRIRSRGFPPAKMEIRAAFGPIIICCLELKIAFEPLFNTTIIAPEHALHQKYMLQPRPLSHGILPERQVNRR
jgi:hypothetical protein